MFVKLKEIVCNFFGWPSEADKKLAAKLIAFEEEIANDFHNKLIPHPIHLNGGDEYHLIDIFKSVKTNDWVLGTWRGHWISLLKGVPTEEVRAAIHKGRSIGLCFNKYRVICSAIVGGVIPIALGIAMAVKARGDREKVWVFVGEMSAETGAFHEALKYAENHKLPITFVISDNGKSVVTDTRKVWKMQTLTYELCDYSSYLIYYRYKPTYPHSGTNKGRIQF